MYDDIMEYIYHDLSEYYWDELWETFKKGGLRENLEHEYGEYDPFVEYEELWEKEHPFITELVEVLDKWKPILGNQVKSIG